MPGRPTASTFTAAARALSQAAAELDLVVPGFRSPPRIVGVNRTIKRSPDGVGGVVAVRVSGRPFTAAIGDMIEGVLVVNRLDPAQADSARSHLWRTMLRFTAETSGRSARPGIGGAVTDISDPEVRVA